MNSYNSLNIKISSNFNGSIKQLLLQDSKDLNNTVAIETPFMETTRDGKRILRFVRLALTSTALVVACGNDDTTTSEQQHESRVLVQSLPELLTLYPWKSVKLSVFKRSKRQCLKAEICNKPTRYFLLQALPKMKIFWRVWCQYIRELNNSQRLWPFTVNRGPDNGHAMKHFLGNKRWETNFVEVHIVKDCNEKKYQKPRWTDKYLYLGSIREGEDKIQPIPIPGLGKTEEIKLLYLKPRYFGCWEQSEHWVQCGESSSEFACPSQNSNNDVTTE